MTEEHKKALEYLNEEGQSYESPIDPLLNGKGGIYRHFNSFIHDDDIPYVANLFLKIIYYGEEFNSVTFDNILYQRGNRPLFSLEVNINHHYNNTLISENEYFKEVGIVRFSNLFYTTLAISFCAIIWLELDEDALPPDASHKKTEEERFWRKFHILKSCRDIDICFQELHKIKQLINFTVAFNLVRHIEKEEEFSSIFQNIDTFIAYISAAKKKMNVKKELLPLLPEIDKEIEGAAFHLGKNEHFANTFLMPPYDDKHYNDSSFTTSIFWIDLDETYKKLMNENNYANNIVELANKGANELNSLKKYLQLIIGKNDYRAITALQMLDEIIAAELANKNSQEQTKIENGRKALEANKGKNYVDEKKQQLDAFNEVWEEIQERVETIQGSDLSPQVKEFRIAQLMEQSEKAKQEIFGL